MTASVTSHQRVLDALNHIKPDRTPCNYVGTPEIDHKLMRHFQTDNMDVVLAHLGVDLRVTNAIYKGPELRKWPDGRFENFWGQIRKAVKNEAGEYFEAVQLPYAEFETVQDVENFKWPKVEWFDFWPVKKACQEYRDYAIIYGSPGNMDLINGTAYGRGIEQVMLDIALEDPVGLACMDKRFECCYQMTEKALNIGGGRIDILWIGDDYGSQNSGLLINPKTWRKLFYPKIKTMCELGHMYGAKVMLHSCGSTKAIWPDLIEAGVDIYDTVQPEAMDMDPAELKREFGKHMCLHGTISTQNILPFGTTEDVRKQVRQRIETLGYDGGFILAPSHNIQPDTSIDNILAMFDEVNKVGTAVK